MKIGNAAVASVLSLSALAGCTRNLDMEAVKTSVRDMVTQQIGANVKSVTCPDSREIKAGDSFSCKVEIDHGATDVQVTQKDDAGNIDMKTTRTVLKVGDLEKLIAAQIQQNSGLEATVDCGPKFRPSIANETFDCTATAGADTAQVRVTVKDEEGNVAFATLPSGDQGDEPGEPEGAE